MRGEVSALLMLIALSSLAQTSKVADSDEDTRLEKGSLPSEVDNKIEEGSQPNEKEIKAEEVLMPFKNDIVEEDLLPFKEETEIEEGLLSSVESEDLFLSSAGNSSLEEEKTKIEYLLPTVAETKTEDEKTKNEEEDVFEKGRALLEDLSKLLEKTRDDMKNKKNVDVAILGKVLETKERFQDLKIDQSDIPSDLTDALKEMTAEAFQLILKTTESCSKQKSALDELVNNKGEKQSPAGRAEDEL